MIPEEFRVHREVECGGVLHGIFHHSMSLKWAAREGVMPPLVVFNHFMACGYDDVAEDIGYLDIWVPSDYPGRGAVLYWEPFELTRAEYDGLLAHIRSLGHEFEVADWGVTTFQEWFNKLVLLCERKRRREKVKNRRRAEMLRRGSGKR